MTPPVSPSPPLSSSRLAFTRTRRIATALLLLMAAIFLLSWHFQTRHPALPYLRAFSEAALIGGLADWFAIVALFRQPLGLPIPHTAIIPRNKQRIGRSLGDFVSQHLLDPSVLQTLLRPLAAAGAGGDDRPSPLAPVLAEGLARVSRNQVHQAWIAAALAAARDFVARHQDDLRAQVSAGSSRWIPGWVDTRLADRLGGALLSLLDELQSPGHPWRLALDDWLQSLPARLAARPDWQAQLAAIESALRQQAGTEGTQWLADLIAPWLLARRQAIGDSIAGLITAWDTPTLVAKLEGEVGSDLHYIRLNGTLVGGLVGLLLFTLTHWLG